ncbi:hypothetical protein BU25DRAFT_456048 [Macroventuria anomochaeta]|uniref:Uncharacterized protein n=1 Tax=Macroventuria anomochaeta TaxID=301207 RepID=A0ACB6S7U9_9PLEO|nr:uncharacterized protein BU25DRAFT_456048 [Macroventuria anomochaeta]KAF2630286.1 hypothetical protein BU25DRAFT_456048 [Macroventuria anomochaeta]
MPPLWQIERELGQLAVYVMGGAGITGDTNKKNDTSDKDDKDDKGDKGKKGRPPQNSEARRQRLLKGGVTFKMNNILNHLNVRKRCQELEEKGKQTEPKNAAGPERNKEEQEALQSIQTAQQQEAGAEFEQEEESSDNGLEAAMLEALANASSEPEPAKKQPAKDLQKKITGSKLSTTESAPEGPTTSKPRHHQ